MTHIAIVGAGIAGLNSPCGTPVSRANFQGADLSYADLRFSSINKKQIEEAKTIKGAKR
jgi:uncharacterized protein YjbI with pentapeptide repeats